MDLIDLMIMAVVAVLLMALGWCCLVLSWAVLG